MDKVAALLPNRIEDAVNETPVSMLIKAVEPRNIEAFLCVELMKLKGMVNVDDRLNLQSHQIPMIAQTLLERFKNENLADFVLCFKRGAMGLYDDLLLRIDGSVIMHWMSKYLDEKYHVIEGNLMKEKDKPYEFVRNESNTDWLQKWKDSVGFEEPKESSIEREKLRQKKDLDYDNFKKEFAPSPDEVYRKNQIHIEWIKANFNPITSKPLDTWMDEKEWTMLNYPEF